MLASLTLWAHLFDQNEYSRTIRSQRSAYLGAWDLSNMWGAWLACESNQLQIWESQHIAGTTHTCDLSQRDNVKEKGDDCKKSASINEMRLSLSIALKGKKRRCTGNTELTGSQQSNRAPLWMEEWVEEFFHSWGATHTSKMHLWKCSWRTKLWWWLSWVSQLHKTNLGWETLEINEQRLDFNIAGA